MSERTGAVVMSRRPSTARRKQLTRRTSLAAINRGPCIPLDGRRDGRRSTAYDTACERSSPTGRRAIVHEDRIPKPTLAHATEIRHLEMDGHSERMASLAAAVAVRLGFDEAEIRIVRLAARLHDVGKVGVPADILAKPGPLDHHERALIQMHPLIGDRLLEPLHGLESVRPIVRHHHERWDGLGYPAGLAGPSIPLAARIVAVADALDAMSARRRYRSALAPAEILTELDSGRGTQWDPVVVDAVLDLIDEGEIVLQQNGIWIAGEDGLDDYAGQLPASARALLLAETQAT
jgi:HD-GYP domain-containing protein (c-di-GMP phosphodiesterase class II)